MSEGFAPPANPFDPVRKPACQRVFHQDAAPDATVLGMCGAVDRSQPVPTAVLTAVYRRWIRVGERVVLGP